MNRLAKSARTDVPALLAEVRRLQSDLHECFCDGWRSRLADAEARCAKLKADNERLRRGIVETDNLMLDMEVTDSQALMLTQRWMSNLLAGREWNNCADGAKERDNEL